jgi:uncharacterized protein (DUF1778 family)
VRTVVRTFSRKPFGMATKTDRFEARLSRDQRTTLERAASLTGTSLSAFVIESALERAETLLAAEMSTTVPAAYFDKLLSALDQADRAPRLTDAARRAKKRPRIAS